MIDSPVSEYVQYIEEAHYVVVDQFFITYPDEIIGSLLMDRKSGRYAYYITYIWDEFITEDSTQEELKKFVKNNFWEKLEDARDAFPEIPLTVENYGF